MSHIHVPDGIIPLPWWLIGFLITFLVMYLLINRLDQTKARESVPKAAMASAFMLIAMSVPLGFLPLHLSMAVLTGILVGPGLGFLAVFVVNIILALLGHGGITIVGLNTIVIGIELIVGSYLFRYLVNRLSPSKAAFIAVVPALLLSMLLMVNIVGFSVGWGEALPHHHDCDHDHDEEHHHTEDEHHDHGHDSFSDSVKDVHFLILTGWTALIIVLAVGFILEASLTALIIGYIATTKPDLINLDRD